MAGFLGIRNLRSQSQTIGQSFRCSMGFVCGTRLMVLGTVVPLVISCPLCRTWKKLLKYVSLFSIVGCIESSWFRNTMWTFCWLTLVISMMVSWLFPPHTRVRWSLHVNEGTGLTDGYPAGGVDVHDVCRYAPYYLGKCPFDGLNHRLMSSSKNCLMLFLPLESMSFVQNISSFNAHRTFQPWAIHLQQYSWHVRLPYTLWPVGFWQVVWK